MAFTVFTISNGVLSVLVGLENITLADLSIPCQSFWQSFFWRLEGAVEEAVFRGWGGTAKGLSGESYREQRFAQAFWVVRGILRPTFDAYPAPGWNTHTEEENNSAQNEKHVQVSRTAAQWFQLLQLLN